MTESEPLQAEPQTISPPPPPEAPRPITPRAKKQAWFANSVRSWGAASALLWLAAAYFGFQVYLLASQENWLREHGVRIDAIVWQLDNQLTGRPMRATDVMRLEVRDPSDLAKLKHSEPFMLQGQAIGTTGKITTGLPLTILVDPDNATGTWTTRLEPIALLPRLTISFFILPFAGLTALVAVLLRWRVLKIWQNAPAHRAMVLDSRQTAVAPLSWQVRCAYVDLPERRVLKVHVPHAVGRPEKGQILWLIAPEKKPMSAISAVAFDRP